MKAAQVHPPSGHGLLQEGLITPQAVVQHPLGLPLVRGDVPDDLFVDAFLGRFAGDVGIMPSVVVFAELGDDVVVLFKFFLVDPFAVGHIAAHLHVG